MADSSHLEHLLILRGSTNQEFRRCGHGNARVRPIEDRASHGTDRSREFSSALDDIDEHREEIDELTAEELRALGSIVTITGPISDHPLKLDSLQRAARRADSLPPWLLLSVTPADLANGAPEKAVVWISDKHRADFLKLFEDYIHSDTKKGQPKNRELVANIARIQSTVLEDLWQSSGEPDQRGTHWWEVWLRPEPDAVDLLMTYAARQELRVSSRVLALSDRVVTWIEVPWNQLRALPFTAVPVAEIGRPEFIDTIQDLPSMSRTTTFSSYSAASLRLVSTRR